MRTFVAVPLAALTLLLLLAVAAGGAWAGLNPLPPARGVFVDVGEGRRMHVVCAGPADAEGPTVVLESGAQGWSIDWAAVQASLASRGLRSCAYDRAGLGRSDPGPAPRDGEAVAADLERVLDGVGVRGPLVLVGHSMGGLTTRVFIARNPERVVGWVLADSAAVDEAGLARNEDILRLFAQLTAVGAELARLGLYKAVAPWGGDSIGLPPGPLSTEKKVGFARVVHNRWTAAEAAALERTARQAAAYGPTPRTLPVAVVTAGPAEAGSAWEAAKRRAAASSDAPYYRNVAAATHASLLGPRHAHEVTAAVAHVVAAGSGGGRKR